MSNTNITVGLHKISQDAITPSKQTQGAAAYDVYASVDVILKTGERKAVATGLKVEIPQGYYLSVRPRSGLAIKNGITCINTPGTIDSDYRGEIFILMINLGNEDFPIKKGDRIAQLLLEKEISIDWQETDELSQTQRGEGGFGSTGSN